jgi:hypothetical protein
VEALKFAVFTGVLVSGAFLVIVEAYILAYSGQMAAPNWLLVLVPGLIAGVWSYLESGKSEQN